ncbi:MAG: winged helix-turn-helix domain-containing protein [Candidatus Omnitrophota bacterium]
MITEIGIVAGKILELLEANKFPMSVLEIQKELDEPWNVINMSIGWLVRDNYVFVNKDNELYLAVICADAFVS